MIERTWTVKRIQGVAEWVREPASEKPDCKLDGRGIFKVIARHMNLPGVFEVISTDSATRPTAR